MLVDWEIRQALRNHEIILDPIDYGAIGPNSLDVKLSKQITWYIDRTTIIDTRDPESVKSHTETQSTDSFVLQPLEFVLASTAEKIQLPNNICCIVHGRSSYARVGLQIHAAGFIDAGFSKPPASITLELVNLGPRPIRLYADDRIAQLSFFRTEECEQSYSERKSSKYNGQDFAQVSRIYLDKKNGL